MKCDICNKDVDERYCRDGICYCKDCEKNRFDDRDSQQYHKGNLYVECPFCKKEITIPDYQKKIDKCPKCNAKIYYPLYCDDCFHFTKEKDPVKQ